MATDTLGNVVVSGTFSGTCDVDPGAGVVSLTSAGGTDAYVAKYSPVGTLLWARQFGGTGNDRAYCVAVDPRDNSIAVGGNFSATVDFDPGAGVQSRTSVGSYDAFLSTFDSEGTFQWVGTVGSNRASTYGNSESLEYVAGIDFDADGTIYATGMFNGAATVSFGTGSASLASGGPQNTFILEATSAGNLVWAKQFTSTFLNAGSGIAVMPSGQIAVRGWQHTSKVDFDPGSGTAYGQTYGLSDAYLAVLESNGDYTWATTLGTSAEDGPGGLAVDPSGAIYLVGHYSGNSLGRTIDLDPGVGLASFTSSGDGDVFVVKLSSGGTYVWGRTVGGAALDHAVSASLTPQGQLLISGFFGGTVDFDPGAGQNWRTSVGGKDGFLLTLTPEDGTFSDVRCYGGSADDTVEAGGLWMGSLAFGTAGRSYVSGATTGIVDFSRGAGGVAVGSATGTSGFIWQYEDLNVAPAALAISATSVAENQVSGSVVGTLSTTDPDAGDTFTYTLVAGTGSTDNESFMIADDQLLTTAPFDFETKSSYSVRVRTTDQDGLSTEQVFLVTVTDVNESVATYSSGSWGWAGSFGAGSAVTSMATDTLGNVVVSGTFSGTCDVDPGAGVVSLTSAGGTDAYVAKYSPVGTLLWARQFGGTGNDRTYCVAVDPRDNSIAVGGNFSATVDFDPGAGVQSRTSVGSYDAFLSTFDSEGTFQWVGTVGSNRASTYGNSESLEYVSGIDFDADGTTYATGMFNGAATVSFGTGSASLASGGPQNTFILEATSAGNLVWAKQFTSTFLNAGSGIAVMPSGRIAVRGWQHSQKTDFDTGAGTAYGAVYGVSDAYVAVLESNGDYLWATTFGTSAEDGPGGLAVDSSGALYLVGHFGGNSFGRTIDLDPGAGLASFTSSGDGDVFVVKLSSDGSYVWGRSVGGAVLDQAVSTALTPQGLLVISGFFGGTVDFDPGAGQQGKTSIGGKDGFLLTLNAEDGTFSDVRCYGGSVDDTVEAGGLWMGSLAFGTAGRSYVSGATAGVVDFSRGVGGVAVGSATGTSGFIWQYEDLNVAPAALAISATSAAENQVSGSVVGTLSTTDPDTGDTFTYALVAGAGSTDNASFTIVGDQLRTAAPFDFETKSSYSIRVRTTDQDGLSTEQTFVVTVTDVSEEVVFVTPVGQTVIDTETRAGESRLLKTGAGILVLERANMHTGGTVVEGGEVIIRHRLALGTGGLTVRAGAKVTLDVGNAQVQVQNLELDGSGSLDVGHGGVTVAGGGYSLADMRVALRNGFRANWTGTATMFSGAAGSVAGGGLGYLSNVDGSVSIAFAAAGDTNIDGVVDMLDIANVMAAGYYNGQAGGDWLAGDFNYDNVVDVLDISEILAGALYNTGAYGGWVAASSEAASDGNSPELSPFEAAFAVFAAMSGDFDEHSVKKARSMLV